MGQPARPGTWKPLWLQAPALHLWGETGSLQPVPGLPTGVAWSSTPRCHSLSPWDCKGTDGPQALPDLPALLGAWAATSGLGGISSSPSLTPHTLSPRPCPGLSHACSERKVLPPPCSPSPAAWVSSYADQGRLLLPDLSSHQSPQRAGPPCLTPSGWRQSHHPLPWLNKADYL